MFSTEQEAQQAAKALKAQLPGKGWGIRVWGTHDEWDFECTNGPVSVKYDRVINEDWGVTDLYIANIDLGSWFTNGTSSLGIDIYGPRRRTPLGALRAALKMHVTQMNKLMKRHKKVMKIMTGGE